MATLFQSSICCCSAMRENGFDKNPHLTTGRVLPTNNTESKAL